MRARLLSQQVLRGVLCSLVFSLPAWGQSLLVVPFENSSHAAELEWVGESFAEGLALHLQGRDTVLVSREERVRALELVGLPKSGSISHASLVRLGEELGAEWVLLGRFAVEEDRLRTTAWLLNLSRLQLSEAIDLQGSFAQLLELQADLAWQILVKVHAANTPARDSFRRQPPPVQVSAFESYVRGLLETDRTSRLRYFLQAARLAPNFGAPAFRLGKHYFEDRDFRTSSMWFQKVGPKDRDVLDAWFYLSLCFVYSEEPNRAMEVLRRLAGRVSAVEVWNNLGVLASRSDSSAGPAYFARALDADPDDPDVHFNLGLHHVRRLQWADAAAALERTLELSPDDNEARFLAAQAFQWLGRTDAARQARAQVEREDAELAQQLKEDPTAWSEWDRLKQEFHASAMLRLSRLRRSVTDSSAEGKNGTGISVHIVKAEFDERR